MFMVCILSKHRNSYGTSSIRPISHQNLSSEDKLYQDKSADHFTFQITNSVIVQEYETTIYLTDRCNQNISQLRKEQNKY